MICGKNIYLNAGKIEKKKLKYVSVKNIKIQENVHFFLNLLNFCNLLIVKKN